MLGRTANDLYWLSRSIERADNMARLIDVGYRIVLLPREGEGFHEEWRSTLESAGCLDGYLQRHGEPTTLDELLTHACTGFRRPATGRMVPWELNVDGDLVFQDVPAVATFNDVQTEIAAVRAGMGIGQLSTYLVRDDLAAGCLVPILPQFDSNNVGLYMYYPHRTHIPVRVRRFIDFVAEAGRVADLTTG